MADKDGPEDWRESALVLARLLPMMSDLIEAETLIAKGEVERGRQLAIDVLPRLEALQAVFIEGETMRRKEQTLTVEEGEGDG